MCIGGGSQPDIPPARIAAEPPKLADSAVAAARTDEQTRSAARSGFAGTRLTSGLGGSGTGGAKKLSGAQ